MTDAPAPSSSRESSRARALQVARCSALILILAGALGLRLLRCYDGLPYLHEWDEPQTAGTALQILKSGDYNPHFFNYGSFMIYLQVGVDAIHYLALSAMAIPPGVPGEGLDAIVTEHDTGWHWTISHPSFVFWNRCLVALMGAATVLLVYLIGSRLAGPWAGLAAAAFIAVLDFHVSHSSIVTPNAPVAMLVTLTCYAALRHLEDGGSGALLASFAVCGLAASTKYNAALALILPLTALALPRTVSPVKGRVTPLIMIGLLLTLLVFLLTTPFAALDLPAFLRGAGGEVRHYFIKGQGPDSVEPGWPHAAVQLARFVSTAGPVFIGSAFLGLLMMTRRAAGALLLSFPLAYFVYMTRSRIPEHRNFAVLYPFLAVMAGIGIVTVAGWARRSASLKPWLPAVVRATVVLIVVAALSAQAVGTATRSWEAFARRETRSRAIDIINELADGLPPAGPRVGIASELRVHAEDLARIAAAYEVASYEDLCSKGSSRFDIVLGAVSYRHDRPEDEDRARRMNALTPVDMKALRIVEGRWTHLTFLSNNPGLVFYASPALGTGNRGPRTAM